MAMKPAPNPTVEGAWITHHINPMSVKTYLFNGVSYAGNIAYSTEPVPAGSYTIFVPCAYDPTEQYWAGFYQGLAAPTLLFGSPESPQQGHVAPIDEIFGIVGSYLSESIPTVIQDDGRDKPAGRAETQAEAA